MARLPRLVVPFHPHHLIQRGNDRQSIFREDQDYSAFASWLSQASRRFKVSIHAYVLMTNHLHLLATPSDATGLGQMMQWVGRHYVPYFNAKYQRTGSLWEGRFKATVIDSEHYFLACSRYIELNPVRAGLANHPADYPWSSYTHHVGLRVDTLVTDHPLYWALGNTPFAREAAYRDLIAQGVSDDDLQAFRSAIQKSWPLGSPEFREALEKQLQRRLQPGRKGRPRKIEKPPSDAP